MNDGVKEIEEEVKIDTEQNTETYRIPQTETTGEVDIVFDFKKVKHLGQRAYLVNVHVVLKVSSNL